MKLFFDHRLIRSRELISVGATYRVERWRFADRSVIMKTQLQNSFDKPYAWWEFHVLGWLRSVGWNFAPIALGFDARTKTVAIEDLGHHEPSPLNVYSSDEASVCASLIRQLGSFHSIPNCHALRHDSSPHNGFSYDYAMSRFVSLDVRARRELAKRHEKQACGLMHGNPTSKNFFHERDFLLDMETVQIGSREFDVASVLKELLENQNSGANFEATVREVHELYQNYTETPLDAQLVIDTVSAMLRPA